MKYNQTHKNRGAFSNPEGRFEKTVSERFDDGWDGEEERLPPLETLLLPETSKSIITRNDSPDLGFNQSINPYRGCEHGCIYCYARPSHAYMNLSPGIDFETKIFYKKDAATVLGNALNAPRYQCEPIVLGANTDPYQPAESKLTITRRILEVLLLHRHPVAIITKNAMIERDLDLLSEMARLNLVKVAVSVTSLSPQLKHIMEPRTSAPSGRLRAIRQLTEHGIPVRAMVAPVIPMINDMELEQILKAVKDAGALHASYVLVRLPYEVKTLFREWLTKHFPDRAGHVMSLINQMRGGKDYDATFGKRMRGEGEYANLLETRFRLACKRYQLNAEPAPQLALHHFRKRPEKEGAHQLSWWDEQWEKE
ncbi:Radical SAM superfamily protein [Legionella rubrilucens]|uniref:Radical SAM superfamily protein n=1 Tax=Legionella rubrilucens TaxID=458 RepID=A0A0W0XRG9_9GAMM|nr:PA0069 family radical SAM protein [Legionella rubrilucens]KTD46960.1 Radical SAM superfamily protein [Legionella rubrilucens]